MQDVIFVRLSTLHFVFLIHDAQSFRDVRWGRCGRIVRASIHEIVKAIILSSVAIRRLWRLGHVRPSLEGCSGSHIHHYVFID